MIVGHLRCVGLLCAFALLCGCAVVDYKKPVDTLNTAIEDSAKTITALDEKLTRLHNERQSELVESGALLLEVANGSCALGTKECSLHVLSKENTSRPFPATSLMPNALLALNGLKTYTQRLKAITDADTASQVATSANEALASIQNLTTTIATETGNDSSSKTVAAFREPSVPAVEWFVTRYVGYVKVKALAQATKHAHPVILKLSDWYATSANAVWLTELGDAHDNFIKAEEKLPEDTPPTDAQIKAYVTAAMEFDAALKVHAARPLEKFTVAHEKLMQELNGEHDVTLADAMAAIELLSNEANAFTKLIGEFERAYDARGGN